MKPVYFGDPASAELTAAVRWYEQRRAGLGAELFDAVVATIELIQSYPEAGAVSDHEIWPGLRSRPRPHCRSRLLARWKVEREALFQANTGALARGAHGAAYTLFGLAADEAPPNSTTNDIVHYLAPQQRPDGRFSGQNLMRPPLEDSDVTATALSIRGLQDYAPPGRKTEVAGIVRRGRNWPSSITPRGTEEAAFQLQRLSLNWTVPQGR